MDFKDRLKELRTQRGLYQKEVAAQLNVGRSTVAAWEIGTKRPEGKMLEQIADFFGVSVDYLLGRVDHPQGRYIGISPFIGSEESGRAVRRDLADTEAVKQLSKPQRIRYFLRGQGLSEDDIEAVLDLLEARRLRRERERDEREKGQP